MFDFIIVNSKFKFPISSSSFESILIIQQNQSDLKNPQNLSEIGIKLSNGAAMNKTLEFQILALCLFLSIINCSSAESSTCLMVYKEGGAPAVFKSPKCPRWKLSDHRFPPENSRCHFAVHQGRRKSQEDRIICALDLRIPFPG